MSYKRQTASCVRWYLGGCSINAIHCVSFSRLQCFRWSNQFSLAQSSERKSKQRFGFQADVLQDESQNRSHVALMIRFSFEIVSKNCYIFSDFINLIVIDLRDAILFYFIIFFLPKEMKLGYSFNIYIHCQSADKQIILFTYFRCWKAAENRR